MRNYISNDELEELGESLIAGYTGGNEKLLCIDIEGFISDYLGLSIIYTSFTDNEKIGFLSDGKQPVEIFSNGRNVQAVFPKWNIVLDKVLLSDLEFGRRRFTLAHEAAHFILEKHNPMAEAYFHRVFDSEQDYSLPELKELMNLTESQADRLAATLLMPKFLVESVLKKYNRSKPVTVYGNTILAPSGKIAMRRMGDSLGVSYTALFIRLKHLGLLEYRDQEEYIAKHLGVGGTR